MLICRSARLNRERHTMMLHGIIKHDSIAVSKLDKAMGIFRA